MRKKIVAGNWKMNTDLQQGMQLADDIAQQFSVLNSLATVILFPPFIALHAIEKIIATQKNIFLGAQNVHPQPNGAYTGEISVSMLQSVGVQYVLVGHSERREYFKEDENFLKQKIDALLQNNLSPIFCCGESLTIRNEQKQNDYVEQQLEKSLFHLNESEIKDCVIAYEPIWAIGTGLNATSAQAQAMHQFIRSLVAKKYNEVVANEISILYGGSCKPDNAKEIFSQPDVDGGLIGGASLKANDFIKIIESI